MWGYNGTAAGPDSITPFIAAAVADRGAPAAPAARTRRVAQPEGSPELQATGLPSGIWSGRVSDGCASLPCMQRHEPEVANA